MQEHMDTRDEVGFLSVRITETRDSTRDNVNGTCRMYIPLRMVAEILMLKDRDEVPSFGVSSADGTAIRSLPVVQ